MGRMKTYYEQARNVPGLGSNLIAVAVIVLVGLVAAGFLLPHFRVDWPWTDKVRFSAVVEEAPGMKADGKHAVNIAGIEVGQVTDIQPAPGGHATLTMSVEPDYPVYHNAKIEVRSLAPINDVVVELDQGTPDSGRLEDGATLPISQTSRFIQPAEVLNKLDDRSRSALTELLNQADIALHDSPRDLGPGLTAADRTVTTLQPVVASLRTRHDTIQRLVTDLSTIAATAGGDDKRLAGLIANLQGTLDTLTRRDDELGRSVDQLPGVTSSLRNALSSTTELTTQLNPTLDALHDASDTLPPTLARLTDTVRHAGPLVRDLRPVVRKARPVVNEARPLVSDLDGALGHLKPVTHLLPCATAQLAPWIPDLAAFVFQTSSAFSLASTGTNFTGFGRADVGFDYQDPTGGSSPQSAPDAGTHLSFEGKVCR